MRLTTRNLSKRYGDKWVLRDVSLKIEKGEIVGLLGAPGSGKTTLLKILSGHENSTAGVLDCPADVYFPDTGRQSLFSRLLSKTDSSFDSAAALLGTTLNEGDFALLDEPFRGLGHSARFEVAERVRNHVSRQGGSMLVASTEFETLALICDRILVLGGGEIVQAGPPQEVYDLPGTVTVAKLTGAVNIVEARRLTSSKSELPEFITIDGEHRLFAKKAGLAKLGAINQNVSLAVRPEDISISFGASFPEDNLLRAVVTCIRPLGPTTLIEFDAGGLRLEGRVFKIVGLGVGDECMLGLPPDRIRILKD